MPGERRPRPKNRKRPAPSTPAAVDAFASEGQRRLAELGVRLDDVAATVGTAKSTVSYWRSGAKTPGESARLRLRDAYGIDPDAWDRAPGARVATLVPAAPAPRQGRSTTLDDVASLLDELQAQRRSQTLRAGERVRLASEVARLLALKARLEREQELLEDRIVREHPFWQRIKATLLAALKPHPDAARDVAAALAELEEAAS